MHGMALVGISTMSVDEALERLLANDPHDPVSKAALVRDDWQMPVCERPAIARTLKGHRPQNNPSGPPDAITARAIPSFSWPWGANLPPPLGVKVKEAARLIGGSRSGVYRLLQEGK